MTIREISRSQAAIFSIFVVDYVPAWFPGANWKREGDYIRETVAEMIQVPFKLVRKAEVCCDLFFNLLGAR